ncbi:hypothetical protein BaRGS_00005052 [Batillaria attramentaria]|uniref:F-box protein n=1 Tax=Batillaria attramentaria TaxID=370345 RepID=A0ABD0LVT1_9CAEN
MNLTADLVCMNLSGVEMLTDALFYILKVNNTTFRNLKKLVCTGCYYLSDLGLMWASSMTPELMGAELEGCFKVTEKGLSFLVSNCPRLQNLAVVGTSVGRIPLNVAHVTNVKDMDAFKLVVLRDQSVSKTLKDMVQQTNPQGPPPALSVWNSWSPQSPEGMKRNFKFNVLEVEAQSYKSVFQVLQDSVLSAGTIVVLTYREMSTKTKEIANRLASTIGMALAKCPDVVIVTLGLTETGKESGTETAKEPLRVKLKAWTNATHSAMNTHLNKPWKMEMIDFNGQLQLAAGGLAHEVLESVIDTEDDRLVMVITLEKNLDKALVAGLTTAVNFMTDLAPWVHDPVDHTCFELAEMIPKAALTSLHAVYHGMETERRLLFHHRQPYPHMEKIVDLMEKCGTALYLPGSSDGLCVTDIPVYADVLSKFMETKPPLNRHISCLGGETTCWDASSVEEFVKKYNSQVKVGYRCEPLVSH